MNGREPISGSSPHPALPTSQGWTDTTINPTVFQDKPEFGDFRCLSQPNAYFCSTQIP